jgi:lysophospholipase L1-like esterase
MIGPAPVDDPEQNARIASLSASFSDLCREAGVAFVEVFKPLLASRVWMRQVTAGDGAHPAAAGYEYLAGLVLAGGWGDWLRGD